MLSNESPFQTGLYVVTQLKADNLKSFLLYLFDHIDPFN